MDDLISRQAALDALDEIEAEVADGFGFEYEKWRKYFCDLPPAQPDVPDINVGDMISRAKAIEALDKRFDSIPMEQTSEILMLRKDLRELPPAQSETAKRIIGKSKDGMTLWYQCDMCNEPVDAQDNFCRECRRRLIDE